MPIRDSIVAAGGSRPPAADRPAGDPPSGSARAGRDAPEDGLREVAVETILLHGREAILVHNGVRYRLRVTSNDKLILTK